MYHIYLLNASAVKLPGPRTGQCGIFHHIYTTTLSLCLYVRELECGS